MEVRPALEGKERGGGRRFVYRLDSGCAVETMATTGFPKPERAGGRGRTPIGAELQVSGVAVGRGCASPQGLGRPDRRGLRCSGLVGDTE